MNKMIAAMVAIAAPAAPASAATPAQIAAADAMIRTLYRTHVVGGGDYRTAPWSPEIRQWLRRDDAASGGEVGVFDAVPFCNCQDTVPGARVVSVSTVATGPATARSTVMFRNGEVERFVYDLKLLGGHWTIADIHSGDVPSMLTMLRTEVPRAEHRRR